MARRLLLRLKSRPVTYLAQTLIPSSSSAASILGSLRMVNTPLSRVAALRTVLGALMIDVEYVATGINDTFWQFNNSHFGTVDAVDGEVTIVDTTGQWNTDNGDPDLAWLYTYANDVNNDNTKANDVRLAYTVNMFTEDVAYIYVVDAGWRNSVTFVVDEDLQDDWRVVGDNTINDLPATGWTGDCTFTVEYIGDDACDYEVGDDLYFLLDTGYRAEMTCIGNNRFTVKFSYQNIDWDKNTVTLDDVLASVTYKTTHGDANNYSVDGNVDYISLGVDTTVTITLTRTGSGFSADAYDVDYTVNGIASDAQDVPATMVGSNGVMSFQIVLNNYENVTIDVTDAA